MTRCLSVNYDFRQDRFTGIPIDIFGGYSIISMIQAEAESAIPDPKQMNNSLLLLLALSK